MSDVYDLTNPTEAALLVGRWKAEAQKYATENARLLRELHKRHKRHVACPSKDGCLSADDWAHSRCRGCPPHPSITPETCVKCRQALERTSDE